MGQCTVCGNRGSIESSIAEFFESMNLKDLSIEKFSTAIKSNLKGKKVEESKWNLSIVDNLIGNDKTGAPNEQYRNYFYNAYSTFDFNYLIFSLLLFCRKDTIILKQKMLEIARILKLSATDVFIKSEDDKFVFLSKEFLIGLIGTYSLLISNFAIDYVGKVKSFDSIIVNEMKEQYSDTKIQLFTKNTIDEFIISQNTKLKSRILDTKSNPIDFQKYIDFDMFFDEKYSFLCDDKLVRDSIYESNPRKK